MPVVLSDSYIDLSRLPAPKIIEEIDTEKLIAIYKAIILKKNPQYARALDLEQSIFNIVLEPEGVAEMTVRQRINKGIRAVLLAFSTGTDLDHVAARYGVKRGKLVDNPRPYATNPEDWEGDTRLRRRTQMAYEALSTAGARGAYIFHAMTDQREVADAWAWSPRRGSVNVVLAGENGKSVSDNQVTRIVELFQDEKITPLTDEVSVTKAIIRPYTFTGTLFIPRGPDGVAIEREASKGLKALADEKYAINADLFYKAAVAKAQVGGVQDQDLRINGTASDLITSNTEISFLTGIDLKIQVR